MISENKFVKYEVLVWLGGLIIRRTLATFVQPYSSFANYETSKDICLLLNKVFLARLILTTHQGKERGQSDSSNVRNSVNKGGKDGNPQS